MSITAVTVPSQWSRVNDTNRMVYKFSSTKYTEANFQFQFVLKVYLVDGSYVDLGTYNLHPSSGGTVEFNPSSIYRNYLSYDFDISKKYLTEFNNTALKFQLLCYEFYGTPPVRVTTAGTFYTETTPMNAYNGCQQNIPYDYTPLNYRGNLKWVMNNVNTGTTGQFLSDATEYRLASSDLAYMYALGPVSTGRPDRIRYNVYYAPLTGTTLYTTINATYNSGSTFSLLTTGVSYQVTAGSITIKDQTQRTISYYDTPDGFVYGSTFPKIPTDLGANVTRTFTPPNAQLYSGTTTELKTGVTYTVTAGLVVLVVDGDFGNEFCASGCLGGASFTFMFNTGVTLRWDFYNVTLSYVSNNLTVQFSGCTMSNFNATLLTPNPYSLKETNPTIPSYEQSVANASTRKFANTYEPLTNVGLSLLTFYDTTFTYNYSNSLGYYIPIGPYNLMQQRSGVQQMSVADGNYGTGSTIALVSGYTYKVVAGGIGGNNPEAPIVILENDGTFTGALLNIGDSFTFSQFYAGFYWKFAGNVILEYTIPMSANVIHDFLDFKIENWVYYEVDLIYNFTPLSTYPMRVIRKDHCTNKFEQWQLFWLNPHGGFDTYCFNKKVIVDYKVQRDTYKIKTPPTFSPYDAGERIFNIDVVEQVTLTTDLLTQKESQLIVQLTQSPVVYAIKHYEYQGTSTYFAVPYIITNDTVRYEQKKNDKEVYYEVSMRASNDRIIQMN